MMAANQRIWGYETNFGGLADLAVVKANQLMPKPAHLTWEEAAVNALCNCTSYRMLVGRNGAQMKQGDVVLIWGATGGIGAYAAQYVLNGGGIPVCVVSVARQGGDPAQRWASRRSSTARAAGYQFWKDEHTHDEGEWRRLGKDIRDLVGEDPDIVFEHPGRSTFAASMYVAKRGGTVVTCAATSGFMMEFDNRHFWMRLKRLVGSHFANYKEAWEANRLISKGMIHPVMSQVFPLDADRRGRLPGAPQHARGQDRRALPGARGGPRRHRPRAARPSRRQAPPVPPLTRPSAHPGRSGPGGAPASARRCSGSVPRSSSALLSGRAGAEDRAVGSA